MRASFLRLGALWRVPGLVADNRADFGLIGLANNVNAYCGHLESIVTAGTNLAVTAAQARRRALYLTSGASGGFTITLPTTAQILGELGPTIFTDGSYGQMLSIVNVNIGQTGTLTAGDASTTITGTATIATNTRRDFFLVVNSASALTYYNIGSVSL